MIAIQPMCHKCGRRGWYVGEKEGQEMKRVYADGWRWKPDGKKQIWTCGECYEKEVFQQVPVLPQAD